MFGSELQEARKAAGLSQAELADHVGVSNTYISALESGRKSPPPRTLVSALESALGLSKESLWSAARDEREQRLRDRVDGHPTSERVPRTNVHPTEVQDVSVSARIASIAEQMEALIEQTSDRQTTISLLQSLLDTLRSG